MSRVLLLLLILSFGVAPAARAQEEEQRPPSDPVLGERLIDAVATTERLWVRSNEGAVVAFNRADGARRVLAERGVVDLSRVDGRTVALKIVGETPRRLAVVDIETGETLAPPLEAESGDLLHTEAGWIVLATDAVFRQSASGWTRTGFSVEPRRRFGVTTTAVAADGALYVGRNQGEWGGGLWRIRPGEDALTEVSRLDSEDICDGPLNAACQPVTGIVADAADPTCVIVSTGLSHFFAHGGVLRICGDTIEVLFQEAIPMPEGSLGAGHNTWPMFGLAATPGGWTSVAPGKLFISRDGVITQTDMPAVREWHGLGIGEGEGLLILRTDVNWGMSLSGYTPMLVPVVD